jgi:hypothetical protein
MNRQARDSSDQICMGRWSCVRNPMPYSNWTELHYDFTITGQRGTLWWHTHISWLHVSLYGAIIIHPKKHIAYPYSRPHKELPILFGTELITHEFCIKITV